MVLRMVLQLVRPIAVASQIDWKRTQLSGVSRCALVNFDRGTPIASAGFLLDTLRLAMLPLSSESRQTFICRAVDLWATCCLHLSARSSTLV